MTKKASASFPKLSDYLTAEDNENLNIRTTVKAVRQAFQSGELDVIQTSDALKIVKGKGLTKAQKGDKAIIYDFIIFEADNFEAWLESNRHQLQRKEADGQPSKMTPEQLVKLRTDDPEAFKAYQDEQRSSIKVYNAAAGKSKGKLFTTVYEFMNGEDYAGAIQELNKIQTRGATSPNSIEKARLMKEAKDKLDLS